MIQDYFIFAFKNLKHRGIRSWLTLLGIFIGVTAVVALISLGNGLQLAVSSQFGISETELITVQAGGLTRGPPGSFVVNPLITADLTAIKHLSSVKIAISREISRGKIEFNKKLIFGYVASVPSGSGRQFMYEELNGGASYGRLLSDSDAGKVVLGYSYYANKMGLGESIVPRNRITINGKDFIVEGILSKQGSFIFDNSVYMNEKDMKSLYNLGDKIDAILVQPAEKNNLNRTQKDIENLLLQRRHVKKNNEDFTVSTPAASLANINSILQGVQIFIAIVASISIFIGALGIVNTMTTSVWERKKEIGIMKSIGARNSNIFFQFFVEAGLLGFFGGLIGVIFGMIIGFVGIIGINNFLNTTLVPRINLGLIFFSLFGSFLIGAISGIIPAMKASRQNPVEALRG